MRFVNNFNIIYYRLLKKIADGYFKIHKNPMKVRTVALLIFEIQGFGSNQKLFEVVEKRENVNKKTKKKEKSLGSLIRKKTSVRKESEWNR